MTSAVRALERFFFADVDRSPAVWARLFFGGTLVANWTSLSPAALALFGPDGIGGAASLARVGGVTGRFYPSYELLCAVTSPALIVALYALLLLSSLAFTAGLFTRTSGAVALVLHVLFCARNPLPFWGWHAMLPPFLAYVLLADCGGSLSVDAWLRARRDGVVDRWRAMTTGPAWPLRLLQVHVAAMYAVAGLSRLDDPMWLAGDGLYVALQNLIFGRLAIEWSGLRPALALFSLYAFVIEPLAPFTLWLRRVGPYVALGLIALHVGIEVLTTVGYWNFVLIGGLGAFCKPAWLHRVLRLHVAREP